MPHLISTGAASLIDEFYAEVHVPAKDDPSSKRMPLVVGKTEVDGVELVASMRRAGVYAHQWS